MATARPSISARQTPWRKSVLAAGWLELQKSKIDGSTIVNPPAQGRPGRALLTIDEQGLLIFEGVRLLPHRLRAPDLEIVKPAVIAHAAKLHLRLRRMGDAGGLQEGHGLAVDGGAQGGVVI